MPSRMTRPIVLLLAISAFLHFYKLAAPPQVVFDEAHFGGYVNAYCGDGSYFFDIHPPHAKLLIAGVAALAGYAGEQDYATVDAPITKVSPALLRLVPSLVGTLLPLIVCGFMRELGASRPASLLAGLAIALENALILQTRLIALDGILVASILAAVTTALVAVRQRSYRRGVVLSGLAGVLAGLAAGTKFTGLVAIALVGIWVTTEFIERPSRGTFRRALGRAASVLLGASVVYLGGWYLHFELLPFPGPGDLFGRPTGNFLTDLFQLHGQMFNANAALDLPHPYASPWWSWPWLLRPMSYAQLASGPLYLLGNPVVWLGSSAGACAALVHNWHRRLRRNDDGKLPSGGHNFWIPVAGYVLSLAPLAAVTRTLFLYHYLTPLVFAVSAGVLYLDREGWIRPGRLREQSLWLKALVALLLLGFAVAAPFTFPFVEAPSYQEAVLRWLPHWR